MKFSIIIPVYRDEQVKQCLESIKRIDYPTSDYEVIVVENGKKTDWLEPLVTQNNWRYFFNEPASAYAARNLGMTKASGDMFAFADADCVVAPDWLRSIATALTNTKVDGVMGKAYGEGNSRVARYEQQMYEANIAGFTNETKLRRIDTRNFAIRRAVYEKIGAFANVRFGGDMEYGARAHAAGLNFIFSTNVVVLHQNPTRLSTLLKKRRAQNAGNMRLLTLHDRNFNVTYFPQLLRYQPGFSTRLLYYFYTLVYWLIRPSSDTIAALLPEKLGYIFFKAANVLAIRLGQLTGIIK